MDAAAEMTIPAAEQPGRTTRITAIAVAGMALVLAILGAVALAGNVLRDGDGYFDTPTETFTSGGYAIAMKSVDISDAPQWALDVDSTASASRPAATARSSSASPVRPWHHR
jgi:hypothetical protein